MTEAQGKSWTIQAALKQQCFDAASVFYMFQSRKCSIITVIRPRHDAGDNQVKFSVRFPLSLSSVLQTVHLRAKKHAAFLQIRVSSGKPALRRQCLQYSWGTCAPKETAAPAILVPSHAKFSHTSKFFIPKFHMQGTRENTYPVRGSSCTCAYGFFSDNASFETPTDKMA